MAMGARRVAIFTQSLNATFRRSQDPCVCWHYSIKCATLHKRNFIILYKQQRHHSLACFYSIAGGRISHQYIARWPRNATMVCNTLQQTIMNILLFLLLLRITIRPPGILHVSITRYMTSCRHLHIIHDTPNGNVPEHQPVNAHTIISKYYYTQIHNVFTLN